MANNELRHKKINYGTILYSEKIDKLYAIIITIL